MNLENEIVKRSPKKQINTTELANMMNKLSTIMSKNGEPMKSRAYQNAEDTLLGITEPITDIEQLKGKPGIGSTMIEKMKEFVETGTLKLLEKEKENPINVLTDVYGIGPKKAKELVEKGITTIEKLREQQNEVLNDIQKIGLQYYDDILERIPRSEIDEYNEVFERVFKKVAEEDSRYEIVGSYRRGAKTSGDIDVIITSKNDSVFKQFIDELLAEKVIIEVLSRGKTKCLVITKLGSKHARRVDFLYTNVEEYPFAVLYFTGSKAFNTVMRGHALRMGYTLNEHRIKKNIASLERSPDKSPTKSPIKDIKEEKDIFDLLKLEFKNPDERLDGRAVVPSGPIQFVNKPKKEKTVKKREPKEPKPPKEPKEKTRKKREPKVKKSEEVEEEIKEEVKEEPRVIEEVKDEEPIVIPEKVKKTRKKREPKEPKSPKKPKEPKPPKPPKEPKEKTRKKREPKKQASPKEEIKIEKESKNNDIIIPEMPSPKDKRQSPKGTEALLEDFKVKGFAFIEVLSEKQLSDMVKVANDYYHNTKTPIITDNEYDIIKEYLERKYPKNAVLEDVGAPITKNKAKLPYEMASMDKIKPDSNALPGWLKKYNGPYVISCKLDGVSGLYTTEGDSPKLYTRGNGTIGQDISHLLSVLQLPKEPGIVVRGEFIIPKKVFDEKYKNEFANPRNLVSGIVNSKTLDSKAKDLHFVTYEVIKPVVKPSEQMEKLKEIKHEVVRNKTITELSNDILSEILMEWRKSYEYEIDGIIICNDEIYERKSGNPDHAFAFKMVLSDQMAEAKVVDVIWTASKDGYLKPRVRIEPIRLAGVTIEYATGFNGKFIEDNKIGLGALIQIIRSGDVIPHIKSVTTPAEHAKMPLVPYAWTATKVDIVLENAGEDITVREKNITAFFVSLEVEGVSSGNVKRIMTAGFDTIAKILKMTKEDFKKVEGFKEKMIEKVFHGIHEKVGKASILDIMVASNLLGRGLGERKLKPIIEKYPTILTSPETNEEKNKMLRGIDGIGPENAKSFVNNIPMFMDFLRECSLEGKLSEAPKHVETTMVESNVDTSGPLYQKKIVMTKVRDKEIIDHMVKVGASLEDNIKKDTFVLIVKTHDDVSNKTKYATENNIPIMTPQEFRDKYMN
jgi:NAD-dependent DNA ligase